MLFGFPIDMDPTCKHLLASRRFQVHSKILIEMLDTTLNLLGPDFELLSEILEDLGRKHVSFGVRPEMYASMGGAVIFMLEQTLGESFTEAKRAAWKETYGEISQDMIRAQMSGTQ